MANSTSHEQAATEDESSHHNAAAAVTAEPEDAAAAAAPAAAADKQQLDRTSSSSSLGSSRINGHIGGGAGSCRCASSTAASAAAAAAAAPNNQQQLPQQHQQVWYSLPFRTVCELCLAMPIFGLLGCLLIACLFQFGDIQETACKVTNFVPSISAVTGISPGRYLWRVSIAFHVGPRLLIVITYYHFLKSFASRLRSQQSAAKLTSLLNYCFYLQIVEIAGLCLISFIHNREHYPTHQKGFILYLGSSHLSFFLTLKIYDVIWPLLNEHQMCSYRRKVALFLASFTFLFIMVYYYYRHFIHCDIFAFSKFATAEYFVAVTNMAFYWTLTMDLPTEQVLVLRPPSVTSSVMTSSTQQQLRSASAATVNHDPPHNNNNDPDVAGNSREDDSNSSNSCRRRATAAAAASSSLVQQQQLSNGNVMMDPGDDACSSSSNLSKCD